MTRRPASQSPKPPPFPIGARVRYIGTRRIGVGDNPQSVTWVLFPGATGSIVRTNPGRRGTGRPLFDEDGPMYWEDDGEPILDDTKDGYSVWVSDHDPRTQNSGRCIDPDPLTLEEWELIP
jgi:hypothetical protein